MPAHPLAKLQEQRWHRRVACSLLHCGDDARFLEVSQKCACSAQIIVVHTVEPFALTGAQMLLEFVDVGRLKIGQ